ncbi:hypothetical protein BGZ54_004366 [Gamsiella multidivaricata]|nr:hypothetical protein BGZ54_004366 [Gamsiella multidivaricata]
MNDQDMSEAFDFKALSLEEPEERLQKTFEHSFHLDTIEDRNADLQTAISHGEQHLVKESSTSIGIDKQNNDDPSATIATQTPDNGPWAKLPSPSEVNPYQPGITAQKLDAMAMNPNHVFRSAQTPDPFPFTLPPNLPPSDIAPEARKSTPGTRVAEGNDNKDESMSTGQDAKAEIPAWMLEDPKLTRQSGWGPTDTSDVSFGWPSDHDLATVVDSNMLFGFSSYPTYETLPISSTIAEEQYRRSNGQGSSSSDSLTDMQDGGFAKYGQAATFTGASDAGASGHRTLWGGQESAASTALPSSNQQQWQNWRSESQSFQDHDLDLNYDIPEDESSQIKATPGFAPAQFRHD